MLTGFIKNVFLVMFKKVQVECYTIAKEKGWYETNPSICELLGMIHTEVSEATQASREKYLYMSRKIPEFTELEEELADVILRVMSLSEHLNLNVKEAILAKMEYNRTRPTRHGKKF